MILLVDTSVALKWVHEEGESEVEPARRLLTAHRAGTARVLLLDLAVYEFGNVLLRALRQPAAVVTQQLDLLRRLCGPLVHPAPSWHAEAAALAEQHALTFYDASWAAAARALGCPLVSADRALLGSGLAVTPTDAAARI
ncbi:type II toxin-antitoxin system VapC family toxin [Geodermatophilus sp. YIM 151500]|uniref:type II toxin-antitoxin system VapC family toxin n=1 Tax=Geodermatophilus sp. YIM 151500 TaxID=2984531 RepID=UPI0021E50E87|nr:type II toxin-antitoxin system VapC family toxin [Geodermatophilus sp. YIM 151500]MCV2490652.1 type II toxin-antitoxin system VapC family toxin [Geodermatophilus sp. YIM 151500]